MNRILMVAILAVFLGGCLSAFERVDIDQYEGASATWEGNGRTTSMITTSQPTGQPVIINSPPERITQKEPAVGVVFTLRIGNRAYEAMKKTDGKIYILREIEQ